MTVRTTALLLPLSIVVGCGLIGLGLYFGLSSGRVGPAPTVVNTPLPPPPLLPAPLETLPRPERFGDLWAPHQAAVARQCATQLFAVGPSAWYVEVPFELDVRASGELSAIRSFGSPRQVSDSGAYGPVSVEKVPLTSMLECLRTQVLARVRFPPAAAGATLRVWVRVADTSPPPG